MTEKLQRILSDSKGARWTALFIVAFTMMTGYFITDVMSPLEVLLDKPIADGGLGWTSDDYGFFAGSYGLINVFLLMLFFGGIILDKMGIRFTGIMACGLMVIGVFIKYYGVTGDFGGSRFTLSFVNFSLPMSAAVASLGFAIFGVGCEICGITVSKIITKWFTGHELALAMGIQVALARLGTAGAMMGALPFAKAFGGKVDAPVLLGLVLLVIGFLSFIVYTVMDKKLDKSVEEAKGEKEFEKEKETLDEESDDDFHFSDLKYIFSNPGFWCICLLCLLFYSGVFPFLKFATKLSRLDPVRNHLAHTAFRLTLRPYRQGSNADAHRLRDVSCRPFHLCHPHTALRLVCRDHHDHVGRGLLFGTICHVAERAKDYPDEIVGLCLRHHLLHSEHWTGSRAYVHR